ncbi:GH25 family lysozyme M1 (1,4-beta-N-acetylmuramidase) [Frondihabitans sp. PhB188]|uniref:GH25 family lysozyme n=1 Tax=Frondihabitans sp. PhB188 TaxID=2485200 RepID=UPI000FB2D804|nr:GH25 family lysozyme [Frondihabitans sp. PhB188]ROQ37260.1 GH25 family lysozyme M1 (1,4-beta-N-acetylmuramidase) [Frondihabitans sp. PhB188]
MAIVLGATGSTQFLPPSPSAPPSRAAGAGTDPSAAGPTVPGLDVSAYQHGVDFEEAYAKGARFAYIKATEGVHYTSARFATQYTKAKKAGVIRGAFHFAKPNVSTAVAQAEYFVAALDGLGGGRVDGDTTLPPLLDLEYNPYAAADGTDSCWGLSPKQMVLWVRQFTDTVTGLTGRVPLLYTTTDWWKRCTADSAVFDGTQLFLARYVSDVAGGAGDLPASWPSWTIWQYTSTGSRYAGITTGKKDDTPASDEDLFAGTLDELRALARLQFDTTSGLVPGPGPLTHG